MTQRTLPSSLRQTGPIEERRIRIRVSLLLLDAGRVYLLKSVVRGSELWNLPGGGVDWGETLEEAARREAREELGVDVEIGRSVALLDVISPEGDHHSIEVIFAASSQEPPVPREEPTEGDDALEGQYNIAGGWFHPSETRAIEAHPRELLETFLPEYIEAGGALPTRYFGNAW